MSLSCELCGDDLPGTDYRDGEPIWWDCDEVKCMSCGSLHKISVDEAEGDDELGTASVGQWWCPHNVDDATPCPACEAEHASAEAAKAGSGSPHNGA